MTRLFVLLAFLMMAPPGLGLGKPQGSETSQLMTSGPRVLSRAAPAEIHDHGEKSPRARAR